MRVVIIILIVFLLILQYQLWISDGSLTNVHHLETKRSKVLEKNKQLHERNESLKAEVKDLREGVQAIEELARSELGLIKEGEVFYQIIDREDMPQTPTAPINKNKQGL